MGYGEGMTEMNRNPEEWLSHKYFSIGRRIISAKAFLLALKNNFNGEFNSRMVSSFFCGYNPRGEQISHILRRFDLMGFLNSKNTLEGKRDSRGRIIAQYTYELTSQSKPNTHSEVEDGN